MVKNFIVNFNTVDFVPKKIIPKQGNLKLISIKEVGDELEISASRCKKILLNKRILLNHNDFISIGLYLAEGTTYINWNKKYKHSGEIVFVNANANSVSLVCDLLERFNISRNKLKWAVGLNINYKEQVSDSALKKYWLNNIDLNERYARPKWLYYSGMRGGRLSNNSGKMGCLHIFYSSVILRNIFVNFVQQMLDVCIQEKSKEKLAAILTGFFAGDGNVSYSEKFNRRQVEFSCTDLELIEKIRKALEILGLKSIRETWPEASKTHTKLSESIIPMISES